MKIRNNYALLAALCIVILGACFSPWDGSDSESLGKIAINLGNSGARFAVQDEEAALMEYTVTLTSPGKTSITEDFRGVASATIEVEEGTWKVAVEATGNRVLSAQGEAENVAVKAGETATAHITMAIIATRVYEWSQLVDDLADSDGNMGDLEYIEIAESFTTTGKISANLKGTAKDITLRAVHEGVTITRGKDLTDPLFRVYSGYTLTLDGVIGGKIAINGDRSGDGSGSTSALINVGDTQPGGTLIMRGGVSITNNITGSGGGGLGGGIYVKGGTFSMEGGTISGNTANTNGGGVYVDSDNRGIFTMKGGTISGNTANTNGGGIYIGTQARFEKTGGIIFGYNVSAVDDNANKGGPNYNSALYIKGDSSNETLGENDNWPQ